MGSQEVRVYTLAIKCREQTEAIVDVGNNYMCGKRENELPTETEKPE